MESTAEKKPPTRNLERASSQKFPSYGLAASARERALKLHSKVAKAKIFARSDGSFDLVAYHKIGERDEVKKIEEAIVAGGPRKSADITAKAIHGLRSKDRKKAGHKAV
jgi:hypothetical protein